jgi:hypothetical protein
MLKDGYVKTCQSYTEYCLESSIDTPRYTQESFSRECRKTRHRIEKRFQPKQPFDVTTPLDSTDFHKVDLNKYEITGLRVNTWGAENNQSKQVRLDLKGRKDGIDIAELVEQFKKEVAEHSPILATTPWTPETGKLLEISIPDLHLGLLSWNKETGMDYDIRVAREAYLSAVNAMVSWGKQHGAEQILIVVGHDLLNSDTPENTTAKGTRQDEDSRHVKSFEFAWRTVKDAIEICLSEAPTTAIFIRGNHDTNRITMVGEVIRAWFRDNSAFNIDNDPKDYKIYVWGKCMICHTHGHLCKHDKIPGIFATDFPREWGDTVHRTCRVGHGHTERVREFPGMTIEMVPSLGAPSAWTASSGYRSQRAAFGYIWDKEHGNEYVFKYRPKNDN